MGASPIQAGFRFQETLTGTYYRVARPEEHRPFSFTAVVLVDDALRFLRDGRATLEGTLRAEGFAEGTPIQGLLEMSLAQRRLRYEFAFHADDRQPYRFAGQKDVRLEDLRATLTTLPGAIYDVAGDEVARAVARFDLEADLVPFLLSWRPILPILGAVG